MVVSKDTISCTAKQFEFTWKTWDSFQVHGLAWEITFQALHYTRDAVECQEDDGSDGSDCDWTSLSGRDPGSQHDLGFPRIAQSSISGSRAISQEPVSEIAGANQGGADSAEAATGNPRLYYPSVQRPQILAQNRIRCRTYVTIFKFQSFHTQVREFFCFRSATTRPQPPYQVLGGLIGNFYRGSCTRSGSKTHTHLL